jgi:hypothetical protein
MSIRCIAIAAMTLALCAGSVEADIDILGNIPPTYLSPTYNTNGQVNTGLGLDYAVEFKATSTETVDSATLVLTIQTGTTPTLGIYNANGSGGIGSLVGSFSDSSLTHGTAVTETFEGTAALTSGNKYFLVLDGNAYFNWSATYTSTNLSGLVPTGLGATYLAAGSSGSYAAGNSKPSLELDAVAVPEPSSLLVVTGVGALAGLVVWARRRRAEMTAPT